VVCERYELSEETILGWIQCDLIRPVDSSGPYFDEEDLSRIQLIHELQETYGTNDETTEVILHLVDQIHHLTAELKKVRSDRGKSE
jgi:DNA-binding transcriptional MerR regulator